MMTRGKKSVPPARGVGATSASERPEAAERGAAPVADGAIIMGIPEAELTVKVRQAVVTLLAEVDSLRRELKDAKRRVDTLERLADQDTLVPVVNRRAFVRELSRATSYARRYKVPCSVLYFDVDHLKTINDSHGHAAGDAVIAYVAGTLVANVRESDVVGRLGGDEFGVILVHADGPVAGKKAASLAAAVEAKPIVHEGASIKVAVAFGSHQLGQDDSADHAIAAADKAMYAQKRISDAK